MSGIQLTADITMCILWNVVYLLVIIHLLLHRRATIPPAACAFILPWEITRILSDLFSGVSINYAFWAHLGWASLHLTSLCLLILRVKWFRSFGSLLKFCILFLVNTLLQLLWNSLPNGVLYTSYLVTIAGILIWMAYTARPGYPKNPLSLSILITKLCADLIAIAAYAPYGGLTLVCSISLPLLHILHLCIYLEADARAQKKMEVKQKRKHS